MNTIEIIQLRTAMSGLDSLVAQIKNSIQEAKDQIEVLTIYRRANLNSDLAIRIHHAEQAKIDGPGVLGIRLAAALKEFGLVEHSLWEELK